MAHVHKLPNGEFTGADRPDPDNPDTHWHTVGDGRTSTDPYGAGHTHTADGETTGGPIDV